jgi:hypothetical protein
VSSEPELFVLTRVIDDADPDWNENITIAGTASQISKVVDHTRDVGLRAGQRAPQRSSAVTTLGTHQTRHNWHARTATGILVATIRG